MSNNIVQRIAMKAVIVRDGKVLLLREAATNPDGTNIGRYGFPGGRLENGEPWKIGLLREIKEETGLVDNIVIKQPVAVSEWFPTIREVPHHIVACFLVCEAPIGDVVTSNEHDAYKWVDAESWKLLNIMKSDNEVLTAYFASL